MPAATTAQTIEHRNIVAPKLPPEYFLSPDEARISPLSERLTRVLLVKAGASETTVTLPIWGDLSSTVDLGLQTRPWAVIDLLQRGQSTPVLFSTSSAEPPVFVVLAWNVFPANAAMLTNMDRWGLSIAGAGRISSWGLPWDHQPTIPSTCVWWSEKEAGGPLRDFLLIDDGRLDSAIGCVAAGLLRHVGNPLAKDIQRRFPGRQNTEALPEVRRLYNCAMRAQFKFVSANTPKVSPGDSVAKQFLDDLGQYVRRECPPDQS